MFSENTFLLRHKNSARITFCVSFEFREALWKSRVRLEGISKIGRSTREQHRVSFLVIQNESPKTGAKTFYRLTIFRKSAPKIQSSLISATNIATCAIYFPIDTTTTTLHFIGTFSPVEYFSKRSSPKILTFPELNISLFTIEISEPVSILNKQLLPSNLPLQVYSSKI